MSKYMWYLIVVLIIIVVLLILCIKKEKRRGMFLLYENNKAQKIICEKNNIINEKNYVIRQYEYFSNSLRLFKGNEAIKIVKNNVGDLYIVFEDFRDVLSGKCLDFYLSGERHKGLGNCPRILSTVKNDFIWIEDIFAIDEDCGNGSLLLECLFGKARELNINTIKGELVSFDIEKFDKLEHFYKKNGFKVTFNHDHTRGHIERKIDLEDRHIGY